MIKGEKINGAKYFFYKNSKGEWTGNLKMQNFFSRTFLPINTEYKEAETKELMINILKTDKVPLKEANLDEETIKELEANNVVVEETINSIDEEPKR